MSNATGLVIAEPLNLIDTLRACIRADNRWYKVDKVEMLKTLNRLEQQYMSASLRDDAVRNG